jgi:hypothetical protein
LVRYDPCDDGGCDEPARYDGAYFDDKMGFDNNCYYRGVILDLKCKIKQKIVHSK